MTRLRQYFTNEDSYNNLMNVYKELKGKENLQLRIFLKAIVICCLEAQRERTDGTHTSWMTPDTYFCSEKGGKRYYANAFTVNVLKTKYQNQLSSNWKTSVFGRYPKRYMNQLINHERYISEEVF